MIVELIGHAGAGKSTLARDLESCLRSWGLDVVLVEGRTMMGSGLLRKRLFQAFGLVRRPAVALEGLAVLQGTGIRNLRSLGTLGGLICRKTYIERFLDDPRIVLVDEGVMHAIWSMAVHGHRLQRRRLEQFIEEVTEVDWVVSLRPSRDTLSERLLQRSDHRLSSLSADELTRTLDGLEGVLDLCEAFVDQRGMLIRLDVLDPEVVESSAMRLMAAWKEQGGAS